MTAPAKPFSPRRHAVLNRRFERILPRIRLMALRAFGDHDYELRHELTAEVVARAYVAFLRLARQGKAHTRYAVPLAMFSIRQVKSGRRMGSKLNIKDVSSEHAGINKGITLARLDRYNRRKAVWKEIVVEDKKSGPAEIAAMRIDFDAWLGTLDRREQRIAKTLAAGETTNATARKFGTSPSRISQMRSQLKHAWEIFQGERPQRFARRKKKPSLPAINRSLAAVGEAV